MISQVSSSALHDKILKSEFNKNKEYLAKSFKRLAKALKTLG